ncbi:hypothetical protein GCM10008968_35250 [Bacillus horti]
MEVSFMIDPGRRLNYEQMRELVNGANCYQCSILAEGDSKEINMKSLMSLPLLFRFKGGIKIKAVGNDAEEAINHLKKII